MHITRPEIDLADFRRLLLSQNEIELLTQIAQEALYLAMTSLCRQICDQLNDCLADSTFALIEKERLKADIAIVNTKYLLGTENYYAAFELADSRDRKSVV